MRTSTGVVRSEEVMKQHKPVVHHIEIHPKLGGGVRVEIHHSEPHLHAPKAKEFAPEEGEKFHAHLAKNTGLSWEPEEEGDDESAGDENEVNEPEDAGEPEGDEGDDE